MRTTVDIADPILREVKARGRRAGKSLGAIMTELLAQALHAQPAPPAGATAKWICREMGARVDVSDASALCDAMEQGPGDVGSQKAGGA